MNPPIIRELDEREIVALLARHHVGRLAFTLHDRVDIEPISYVYEEGWIFCRTSEGSKLNVLARMPWVAFEVDEVHGPMNWESAVVHGTFYQLEPEGTESDKARFHRGLQAIRRLMPGAFDDTDPVAFRNVLFGIYIDRMSGRASSSGDQSGR
jgi:nitroimidazol reductase NimA-like FMN-containing flavoprotein (pyridoxamine 5'-phosphate oxidase superfamily)